MSVVQMIMSGLRYPNRLSDYISSSGNWAKFYKGQMVSTSTNTVSAGNVTYGLDSQTLNSYYAVSSTYNLLDIPFDYTNSTIFYMEYKVTSLNAPNIGGFSSGNSKSPKYGVTSIYSINANANPSIVYQEAFPDARLAYYSVAENIGVSMSSTHGMQARSLAVANVPINPKDITSTLFYQNGFGILSASPSTLVMPGYWRKIGDSGATAFRYGIVGSADGGEGTYDVYGNIIDTDTPATFSVQAGDLVIATTMLAKHVVNAVAGGDIQQIFSWTRNRVISGGQNAHGMSIWISKVSTTYSISRAIDQYPGARFLVFRYDPTGVAPALPAVTPITTGGGSSYWRDVRGRPLE